jgi:protease-4
MIKWFIYFFIFLLAIRGCISIFGEFRQKREAIYILKLSDTIISSEGFIKELRSIKKLKNIKAVVLRINSPGGTIGASQEIFMEIENFKKETGIKFVCSIENIGASGAYYVSLACDKVIALPGSIIGSIGVISVFFTVEKLLEKANIKTYIVKSGEFKDTGTPFREPTENDIKYLQDVVMKLYKQFKEDVSQKRPALKDKIDEIADGRIFSGKEAFEIGMIDYIGTFSDAITIAKNLADIKEEPQILWPEKKRIPIISDIIEGKIIKEMVDKMLSPLFF